MENNLARLENKKLTNTLYQQNVFCEGCGYSEIITAEKDKAGHILGFERIAVVTDWGQWIPSICKRCYTKMDRLDHLRLAIRMEVRRRYGIYNVSKIPESFPEYTPAEVNAEAWKLIDQNIIKVDDNGVLTIS